MEYIMARSEVNPDKIPKHKLEQLARPLLRIVREAFEDPRIQEEFRQWQEAKKLKEL